MGAFNCLTDGGLGPYDLLKQLVYDLVRVQKSRKSRGVLSKEVQLAFCSHRFYTQIEPIRDEDIPPKFQKVLKSKI